MKFSVTPLAGVFVALLSMMGAATSGATARTTSSDTASALVVTSGGHGYTSTIRITFDRPVNRARYSAVLAKLHARAISTSGGVISGRSDLRHIRTQDESDVSNRNNHYRDIDCDKSYQFSDTQGTIHWQRQCGVLSSPWGYLVAGSLVAICVNPMYEAGMWWHLNGHRMSQNAVHTVGCGYTFHGTLTPVDKGDKVDYADIITFACDVGDHCVVEIDIHGHLRFRGPA